MVLATVIGGRSLRDSRQMLRREADGDARHVTSRPDDGILPAGFLGSSRSAQAVALRLGAQEELRDIRVAAESPGLVRRVVRPGWAIPDDAAGLREGGIVRLSVCGQVEGNPLDDLKLDQMYVEGMVVIAQADEVPDLGGSQLWELRLPVPGYVCGV